MTFFFGGFDFIEKIEEEEKKDVNRDGVLLLDKPAGLTSHDVIREVRRTLGWKVVGHSGTLDPLATGLLVVLLGEATHISNEFLNNDKSYHVKVKWGVETDTWDREGKITREDLTPIDEQRAISEAQKLVGDLELPIPMYSAVKRGGKKLYEYARQGQKIEIPKRKMSFYDLAVHQVGPNWLGLGMSCTKGSFIRSWAHQLGVNLGVGAHVEELRRTFVAPYEISQGITLEKLPSKGLCSPHFIPLSDCLSSYKTLTLSGRSERLMMHGQIPRELFQRLIYNQKQVNHLEKPLPVRVVSGQGGQLLSLLEVRPFREPKIKRVFNARHKSF